LRGGNSEERAIDMGQLVEVQVPDIGDFKEVEVIEVLVKPGDTVTKEQSLITVESDKASMEIPSSAAGVVKELRTKLGDKVSQGTVVLVLEAASAAAAKASPAKAAPSAAAPAAPAPAVTATPAPAAAPAPSTAAAGPIEVVVPDIGDFKDVEVIEILVKPGDTVTQEQSLITVESDKASMEIPSSAAGVVKELRVRIGDKVSRGSPVALLLGAAAAGPAAAAAPGVAAAAPAAAVVDGPKTTAFATEMGARPQPLDLGPAPGAKPHASPSVRKFARELGVDLTHVRGSGPKGRITTEDVREHVKGVMAGGARPAAAPAAAAGSGIGLGLPAWPVVDFAKFGPIERVEMSRIRRISGPALSRNWVTIPHVTNQEDADITELEAFRVQLNNENAKNKDAPKLTMLAFLIKACVVALKKFPDFNSSIDPDGGAIIRKNYWHIGFAADTPQGLVVPVIRDADRKGVFEIALESSALAAKARDGKLSPSDMQGGTFSISSLGGIGGTSFTPIINAPEVAILGVCRAAMKPVWDGKQFQPRLILPLSLSWDHRVVDGAGAARFNALLAQLLADFRRVML
jgi:pyruvate dehydrogenase E2 component (dihydrolipoamide acetyltransferase)